MRNTRSGQSKLKLQMNLLNELTRAAKFNVKVIHVGKKGYCLRHIQIMLKLVLNDKNLIAPRTAITLVVGQVRTSIKSRIGSITNTVAVIAL